MQTPTGYEPKSGRLPLPDNEPGIQNRIPPGNVSNSSAAQSPLAMDIDIRPSDPRQGISAHVVTTKEMVVQRAHDHPVPETPEKAHLRSTIDDLRHVVSQQEQATAAERWRGEEIAHTARQYRSPVEAEARSFQAAERAAVEHELETSQRQLEDAFTAQSTHLELYADQQYQQSRQTMHSEAESLIMHQRFQDVQIQLQRTIIQMQLLMMDHVHITQTVMVLLMVPH